VCGVVSWCVSCLPCQVVRVEALASQAGAVEVAALSKPAQQSLEQQQLVAAARQGPERDAAARRAEAKRWGRGQTCASRMQSTARSTTQTGLCVAGFGARLTAASSLTLKVCSHAQRRLQMQSHKAARWITGRHLKAVQPLSTALLPPALTLVSPAGHDMSCQP